MAVWELWARREGVPLWRLLGGRGGRDRGRASRSACRRTSAALLDKVASEVAAGYRRVKIKIKPGRDVALVAALRARFPAPAADGGREQRLHARGRGAPRAPSTRFALMMIEQPLGWDDIVDHASLQRRLATPICLDESIRSGDDARRALELGACRDRQREGRPRRAASRARSPSTTPAARAGAPVWCGGMLESGIGRLANVHLQTLPGFTLPGDTSASARYFEEDLVDPPVVVSPRRHDRGARGPRDRPRDRLAPRRARDRLPRDLGPAVVVACIWAPGRVSGRPCARFPRARARLQSGRHEKRAADAGGGRGGGGGGLRLRAPRARTRATRCKAGTPAPALPPAVARRRRRRPRLLPRQGRGPELLGHLVPALRRRDAVARAAAPRPRARGPRGGDRLHRRGRRPSSSASSPSTA